MTRANVARHGGDEFQARWFWLNAANLLNDLSAVSYVAWENGPQGIDDIRVDYTPARATPSGFVSRDHVQCKWHVRTGEFGYELLTTPSFANAATVSWLHRAYEAFRNAEDGGVRFRLLTNWRVATNDPLASLIRAESGSLDIDKLFSGKTTKSAMGKLQRCWQAHLTLDDDELRAFARTLAFSNVSDSLEELRERLNDRLAAVGLKPEKDHHSSFRYDDLIIKLHQQGDVEFDGASFRALCDREGLWNAAGPADRPHTIGIRSFLHRFDALEDRCDQLLDLVPLFDGRHLRQDRQWETDVQPALTQFLEVAASQHASLRLVIDAHVSIALAVGRVLDAKSGRRITIEQRVPGVGRLDWDPHSGQPGPPALVSIDAAGDGDVVLAVSITHDVVPAVRAYCDAHLPNALQVHVHCGGGPNAISVTSGAHAWRIVEDLTRELRRLPGVPGRRIHLFAAAPNAFAFFFGQQLGLGPVIAYEWDFEGLRGSGYQPGLSVS
jgi:hypothetical protein